MTGQDCLMIPVSLELQHYKGSQLLNVLSLVGTIVLVYFKILFGCFIFNSDSIASPWSFVATLAYYFGSKKLKNYGLINSDSSVPQADSY